MNKIKLTNWLVITGLILLALLLQYIALQLSEHYSLGKLILNRLSTAIFVTGLLSLLNKLLLEKNLIETILEKTQLKHDIVSTGLYEVKTNIKDVSYIPLFKSATTISIVHVYGRTWTSNLEDEIVSALNRGAKINVILCDPDAKSIGALSMVYNLSEIDVKKRINEAIDVWKNIHKKVSPSKRKNLNLNLGNMLPSYSLYRFDKMMIVVLNKLSHSGKTKMLNTIVCKQTDNNATLFSNFSRDYDNLIKVSKNIQL